MLSAERRGRIEQHISDSFIRRVLDDFPFIEYQPPDRLEVMELARKSNLSFYDAIYLSLAKEQAVPLATLDNKLSQAAEQMGVEVLI